MHSARSRRKGGAHQIQHPTETLRSPCACSQPAVSRACTERASRGAGRCAPARCVSLSRLPLRPPPGPRLEGDAKPRPLAPALGPLLPRPRPCPGPPWSSLLGQVITTAAVSELAVLSNLQFGGVGGGDAVTGLHAVYLSFSCVRALMRRALAASSEAMRFSCGQIGHQLGSRNGLLGQRGSVPERDLPGAVSTYKKRWEGEGRGPGDTTCEGWERHRGGSGPAGEEAVLPSWTNTSLRPPSSCLYLITCFSPKGSSPSSVGHKLVHVCVHWCVYNTEAQLPVSLCSFQTEQALGLEGKRAQTRVKETGGQSLITVSPLNAVGKPQL